MTKFTHHHLSAEQIEDEHGTALMLTQQEGIEESNVIVIHPWQLRAVCEQFGIIPSDPEAARTIATLQRRMVGLRDRIDGLAGYMAHHSDHKHADLSHELTELQALQDLAVEWCADWEEPVRTATPGNTTQRQASATSTDPAQAELL